jgi:hypothetical protein
MPLTEAVKKSILKHLAKTKGSSKKAIRRHLRQSFPLPDIPHDMALALRPLVEDRTIFEMRGIYCLPADAPAIADRLRGINPPKERKESTAQPSVKWVDSSGEITMLTHHQAKMRRAAGLINHAAPPKGRKIDPTKIAKPKRSTRKVGESNPRPPERPFDIKSLRLPKHNWLRDD